jgi:hypothetical protein
MEGTTTRPNARYMEAFGTSLRVVEEDGLANSGFPAYQKYAAAALSCR